MLQTHLGQLFFYAKIRLFQKYLPLFFRPPPGLREQADTVVYWWTLKKVLDKPRWLVYANQEFVG